MSMTKDLDQLFEEWQEAQINEDRENLQRTMQGVTYITPDCFVIDGVINEEAYKNSPMKVLFISSEPNVDEYSARQGNKISDYRNEYNQYFRTHHDNWSGKMKERYSALYAAMFGLGTTDFYRFANCFAVMDINKRGGPARVDRIERISSYAKLYRDYIRKELEILNPDVIVWIGTNTYWNGIPEILGSVQMGSRKFLQINEKKVPVVPMWQTSYYQSRNTPLPGYRDRTVGKLCAKLLEELSKFDDFIK